MKIKLAQATPLLLKILNACCCTFILLLVANYSFGQAPNISYPSPETCTVGLAIQPLAPSNTGGMIVPTIRSTIATGFTRPIGVGVDAVGNVYVADNVDNVVKKIPVGGGTPVVIGTGFYHPSGLAVDAVGNVYVCDELNDLIKKIPVDGGAIVAVGPSFDLPYAISLDKFGNIYVVDGYGLTKMPAGGGTPVRIISRDGNLIISIAVDKGGNIFYANLTSNQLMEKLAVGGSINIIASEPQNEVIEGVAIDGTGNIFYSTPQYIVKISATTGQKNKISSGFTEVSGIALDANRRIYVSDDVTGDIGRITLGGYFINPDLPPGLNFDANTGVISGTPTIASPSTNYMVTASNKSGTGSTTINLTVAAIAKPAISYIAPVVYQKNNRITPLVPGSTGGPVTPAKPMLLATDLKLPFGIAVSATGNIYYVDSQTKDVRMIPAGGGASSLVASGFAKPVGLAVDGSGNVFVTEGGSEIVKIPAGGGTPINFAAGNFIDESIAADSAGNVYVADNNGTNIVKFSPTGGTPVLIASFNSFEVKAIALDHTGNIFTTGGGGKIIKITAGSHTVVNLAVAGTIITGAATDASGDVYFIEQNEHNLCMYVATTGNIITLVKGGLGQSYAIAVDANGNAYVPSYLDGKLIKITASGFYTDKPLPAGLVIDKATGIITGTPTVSIPATTYNVTAINSGGTSSASFSLAVLANSSLFNLVPSVSNLGPPFKPETLDYNMTVASSVSSITFTPTVADAAATVTVNGVTVASGTASVAIPLTTGDNAVHIVVTATDGSKSTYSVLVTRVPSGNYYLATLLTSNGILSPTFTHLTNNYTTQVGAYVASMTVTPTVVDSTATITVNGTPLVSGATSAEIPLIVGVNPINIAVTAQNGTVNTYTINVTRVPSTNAYLMRILLNHGYDVPLFSHFIFNYATPVPNGVSAIKVTPVGAVTSSTITVNGTVVVSGTPSGDIPLAVGVNNISILVTAQDGVTQNTYTVTVTRESPSLNTVYQPVSVATTNGLDGLAADEVLVHSGLSPNSDGINDFLLIDGIANYPENKLQIMTRNGQLIFEAKNYDNSNKVFDGHSNKNGQLQLPGTYFYSLDYTVKGETKHKTGFIVLKY